MNKKRIIAEVKRLKKWIEHYQVKNPYYAEHLKNRLIIWECRLKKVV